MPKKLLVIESDKSVLACSRMLFKHYGFEVDSAETLETSKELISKNKYDIVVAELCLENKNENDGFEIIAHTKKTSPGTKVIIVTYLCDPAIKRKALEYDIHGYFEKPVSFDKIFKLIEDL
ncbi:MAG: response regulator [Candidatus Edwardsbacteria bacterium]|nr:response regulator [Candidatus Edwardsbacteria bacterium]MBU1575862.1 response regulator [Candidatus Edwardsbacteria bacterium]MBU2463648.1 response regulator [Candidatus Edwardsbacteria bacterium]MBU2593076.1 response regulator [Candidatus Edwardsbacteria bacterium]